MTTPDMVNLIRANTQPLSHRTLQAIADRLEEQHNYLRSCLTTIRVQEARINDQALQLMANAVLNRELLARCDLLEAELSTQEAGV